MITTHVLDTALGRPAQAVPITLELAEGAGWKPIGQGQTDEDGRLRTLCPTVAPGRYRLRFDTGRYFENAGTEAFYPVVEVQFVVRQTGAHYHVPLLLSPFGYSTYRGS